MDSDKKLKSAQRLSLLDVVVHKREECPDSSIRKSRLFFVSKITAHGRVDAITAEMSEMVRKQNADLTGACFFINGKAMLHLLEGPIKSLMNVLKEIQAENSKKHTLDSIRIMSSSEEIIPEYSTWFVRSLTTPKNENQDFKTIEFASLAFSVLKHLLELGKELSSLTESKARELFHSSHTKITTRIPDLETILFFCANSEDLFSLDEYLDTFEKPVSIALDSWKIWPPEPPLDF